MSRVIKYSTNKEDDSDSYLITKNERILLYVVILLLYILVTHPSTFVCVNKLLGNNWVNSRLSESLNVKSVVLHGVVLVFLIWVVGMLMRNGTFRSITN